MSGNLSRRNSSAQKPVRLLRRLPEADNATRPARSRAARPPLRARGGQGHAAGAPPVLVRGAAAPAPARARKSAGKRRFDIALSVPGAEVRLPAMPAIHLGWRFVSGAALALLAFLLYQLWNAPKFRVDGAEITGLKRLSANDVNLVLGISGESIFSLQAETIRQNLAEAYPELKSIEVEISLPAKVSVTVVERQPVLSWTRGSETLWVDAEGVAFPVQGDAGPLAQVEGDLPVARRESLLRGGVQIDPALVAALIETSAHAPEGTPLVYDTAYGLGWKEQSWVVYFGADLSNISQKLIVYEALAAELAAKGIQPTWISVENPHALYYRVEP